MILSDSDLALVRQQPHASDLYLSIYRPTLIFEAVVNDVDIGKDARVITYDNVTVGSYTDIFAGAQMLVYKGANPSGAFPVNAVGAVRVRSATSTQITVAENSNINWADDYRIKIYNYIDVEAVYPRIINDPADDENVIFYKDYDIAYTNQNDVMGTFVCMGPHRACFTGEQIFWSSSGTYNVMGDAISSYAWEFEGGTPTGSASADPGYVQYDTPGHYKTVLTVVSDGGRTDRSYRFVSVYDRPGQGQNPPVQKWEISELSGSRSSGGYSARIKIRDTITDITDNSLVVIFTEDWYADTKISLGGNSVNNSNIFFVGYVTKGSVSYNYRDNYVEFTVGSVAEAMKNAEGFSISCESVVNPSTWFQIKSMTVPRALYHYLRWHSTVLYVTDFAYTGDARAHQYFDTDRSSLFDAINNFLGSALMGELVTDRQGKLWAEISPKIRNNAPTVYPIALAMDKNDWIETPVIEDRQLKETSFLELGGIRFNQGGSGGTGTSTAFLSNAPGRTPGYRGKARTIEGLILTGQAQLNQMSGDVFAYENSKYPSLDVQLRGNYNHLDIAPLERITVDLAADENPRGITLTDEPFHINTVSWNYNPRNRVKMCSLNLSQLVNGVAGDTIRVPEIPDGGGFSQPPVNVPQIPVPGGGGGTSPADYAILTWVDSSQYEQTRNIPISDISISALSSQAKFTVPSDGLYLIGVSAEVAYTSTTLDLGLGVTILGAPYMTPYGASSGAPYFDNDAGGAAAPLGRASVTALQVLTAGTVITCSSYGGTSVGTTLHRFYAWIFKVSS